MITFAYWCVLIRYVILIERWQRTAAHTVLWWFLTNKHFCQHRRRHHLLIRRRTFSKRLFSKEFNRQTKLTHTHTQSKINYAWQFILIKMPQRKIYSNEFILNSNRWLRKSMMCVCLFSLSFYCFRHVIKTLTHKIQWIYREIMNEITNQFRCGFFFSVIK